MTDYTSHWTARILTVPKASNWKCELFGTTSYTMRPPEGQEPNWFWRKMQYLAFGNRWVYDPIGHR